MLSLHWQMSLPIVLKSVPRGHGAGTAEEPGLHT